MTFSRQLVVVAVSLLVVVPSLAAKDPAGRCTADKLKAVAKKTAAKLKCNAAAASKGAAVEAACLAQAEEKFSAAWARIEGRGGCVVSGDEGAIESKVDDYVTDVVTTVGRACGDVDGVCGGACPTGLRCFAIGVGCFGEPEPCRCHGSTTTCPPTTSTSTTTVTTSSSCPTYTTTTLGVADCGGIGGAGTCFGGCANARECVSDVNGVCGCTGALRPCGVYSFANACAGECPSGETCTFFSPILPDGCPGQPQCGCVPSP
jgi:hypothetical protein